MSIHSETESSSLAGPLKVILLSLLAMVVGIVSVSFASQYMRNGFEREYREDFHAGIRDLAELSSRLVLGDDLTGDPAAAAEKYSKIIPAMFVRGTDDTVGSLFHGVYAYGNGSLTILYQNAPSGLFGDKMDVSKWLTAAGTPFFLEGADFFAVMTPVKSSDGTIVGMVELVGSYTFLQSFGNTLDGKALMTATISFIIGISFFSLHYLIPSVMKIFQIKKRRGGY